MSEEKKAEALDELSRKLEITIQNGFLPDRSSF